MRLGGVVERGKARPPAFDFAGKRRVRRNPPFGVELGGAFEQAEHIFAGQRFVVAVGHPMHSCKEIRLRRTQLFTVPSGTPSLPATSPWESP